MVIKIDGKQYYETSDICQTAGISRATLFRWLKAGVLQKAHKNRRGWRIFTEEDLSRIQSEARKIEVEFIQKI